MWTSVIPFKTFTYIWSKSGPDVIPEILFLQLPFCHAALCVCGGLLGLGPFLNFHFNQVEVSTAFQKKFLELRPSVDFACMKKTVHITWRIINKTDAWMHNSLALPYRRAGLPCRWALPYRRAGLPCRWAMCSICIYIYLCILIFATPAAGVAVLFIHLLNFLATSFDILGITPDPCEASKNMPTLSEQALWNCIRSRLPIISIHLLSFCRQCQLCHLQV